MTRSLRSLVLLLGFGLLLCCLSGTVRADPQDWGESDWAKFVEMTISASLDAVHGGITGVPKWMTQKTPVQGRVPLIDAYAALSATSASVKPGLTLWLQEKMREAADAEDWDRMNGYQAYHTALTEGDSGPHSISLSRRHPKLRL